MKYKKIKLFIISLLATTLLVGCSLNKSNLDNIIPNEEVNENVENKEDFITYTVTDSNGKKGLIDEDGSVIVETIYEDITPFEKDLAKVRINDKAGVINRNKDVIIEPIYILVNILKDGYINAKPNEFTEYIFDSKGNLILESKYNSIEYLGQDLFSIRNDKDKVQIVNKNNEVIIPYEDNCSIAKLAKEDLLIVYRLDNLGQEIAQYLNLNGKPSINDKFISAYPFKDDIAVVNKGNKSGAIDEKGNTIIEFKFDSFFNFKNLSSIVAIDDKFGIINKQGEFTTDLKYDIITECLNDDLYIAHLDGKFGVIDKDDNIKIPFKYDMIDNINKDIFKLYLDNKNSLVTKENKVILPLDSFDQSDVYNNILFVKKDGNLDIIDLRTKENLFKDLDITYYIAVKNNSKIIEVIDKENKSYYLNTETCKIVYKQ